MYRYYDDTYTCCVYTCRAAPARAQVSTCTGCRGDPTHVQVRKRRFSRLFRLREVSSSTNSYKRHNLSPHITSPAHQHLLWPTQDILRTCRVYRYDKSNTYVLRYFPLPLGGPYKLLHHSFIIQMCQTVTLISHKVSEEASVWSLQECVWQYGCF